MDKHIDDNTAGGRDVSSTHPKNQQTDHIYTDKPNTLDTKLKEILKQNSGSDIWLDKALIDLKSTIYSSLEKELENIPPDKFLGYEVVGKGNLGNPKYVALRDVKDKLGSVLIK